MKYKVKEVTVNVKNNVIEITTEKDEKLISKANRDNFSIDYNVGNLGHAVQYDENGKPYYQNQSHANSSTTTKITQKVTKFGDRRFIPLHHTLWLFLNSFL